MKKLNKLFICLIALLSFSFLASCDEEEDDSYKYPEYQALTNGDNEYLNIAGFKLTNNDVYYYLLAKYGVSILGDEVDRNIFKDYIGTDKIDAVSSDILSNEEKTLLKNRLNDSITSAVDDSLGDAKYDKILKMNLSKDSDSKYYYVTYYEEQFAKFVAAYIIYRDEIIENDEDAEKESSTNSKHFSEDDYNDYYDANCRNDKSYEILIRTFNSVAEFEYAANGDVNTYLSTSSNYHGPSDAEYYTLSDIKTLSNTMYNKALTFTATGEHTSYCVADSDKVFIMYIKNYTAGSYKEGYSADDFDTNGKMKDSVKKSLYTKMIFSEFESLSTQDYLMSKAAMEERNNASLKIYYEGLETNYVYAYDGVYEDLSITDYDKFSTTTDESKDMIASYKINGEEVKITADKMYELLKSHFEVSFVSDWIEAVLYLNHSDLIKLDNGKYVTVEDKDADEDEYRDTYYDSAVTDVKADFEDDEYEDYGYDCEYGWENFVRDYLGYTSPDYLPYALGSTLVTSSKTEYTNDVLKACAVSKSGDSWYINKGLSSEIALDDLEQADVTALEQATTTSVVIKYYLIIKYFESAADKTANNYSFVALPDLVDSNYASTYKLTKVSDKWYYDAAGTKEITDTTALAILDNTDYTDHVFGTDDINHICVKCVNASNNEYLIDSELNLESLSTLLNGYPTNLTVSFIKAYYDANNDGVADDLPNDDQNPAIKLGGRIITLLDKVRDLYNADLLDNYTDYRNVKSFDEYVTEVVRLYKNGNIVSFNDMSNIKIETELSKSITSIDMTHITNDQIFNYYEYLYKYITITYNDYVLSNEVTFDGTTYSEVVLDGKDFDPVYRYIKYSVVSDSLVEEVKIFSIFNMFYPNDTNSLFLGVQENENYCTYAVVTSFSDAESSYTYTLSDLVSSDESTIKLYDNMLSAADNLTGNLKTNVKELINIYKKALTD